MTGSRGGFAAVHSLRAGALDITQAGIAAGLVILSFFASPTRFSLFLPGSRTSGRGVITRMAPQAQNPERYRRSGIGFSSARG